MQKRLYRILVAGGALAMCSAPERLLAEDGSPKWQDGPGGRIAVWAGKEDPVPAKTEVPAVPVPSRPAAPDDYSGSSPYRLLIETISFKNGVDPDLIDAMMKTESNYNPWAISPKGARGLMQLIPETGRRFGVQNFFDPRENVEGGVRYVKYLLEMFHGNIDLSLAAYNAGENLVARLGKVPPITETRNYIRKIRAAYTKPAIPNRPIGIMGSTIPVISASLPEAAPVADKAKEPPSPPVSDWKDERGVRHFSNLDPVR